MPPPSGIPEAFGGASGDRPELETGAAARDWVRYAEGLFRGDPMDSVQLYTRPDIDPTLAIRHITAILRSFEPKHEHKIAATAFLLARWFAALRPHDAPQGARKKDAGGTP